MQLQLADVMVQESINAVAQCWLQNISTFIHHQLNSLALHADLIADNSHVKCIFITFDQVLFIYEYSILIKCYTAVPVLYSPFVEWYSASVPA